METKKDIGTALKSRLDALNESPDEIVWNNLEAELKKKKKRRVFILWCSGVGLTALFLALWVWNPIHNSAEKNNIETEIKITDGNTTISDQLKTDSETTNSDSNSTYETDANFNSKVTSEESITNQQSVIKTNVSNASEHSNIKTDKHYVSNTTQNSTLKNHSKNSISGGVSPLSKKPLGDINNSEEQTKVNTNLIVKNEKRSLRDLKIAKRDSLVSATKKIKDSIKAQRQSKRLVSNEQLEEKTTDSITEDDQSRWSVTPQATLSYYGAFDTKTFDNFSVNYGVLASYRMTKKAHIRIGVRKLNLNHTIKADSTKRSVEYLEFPLEVKFTPKNYKVNPYITGGLSYFKLQDASNNNSENFEFKATMSLNLGLGLETKLFKGIYFNIESNFNYQVKPFTQTNNIQPFIISLHTGIEYRF